ncbi:MAG TPA: ankyrin repeat domain-containing protein [Candidatus Dormibacteraeota bacterium]|nr:ankyrin repeat domain-containing protein [Candidatus Dormibacteraeota bacterium]
MHSSLPAAPHLEQLRKLARELQRAHAAGQPEARARVRDRHPRAGADLRLADAQLVIAREHGFASWPRLKAYVDRVTTHGADLRHPFEADPGYYEDRAAGLLSACLSGEPEASALFHRHLPAGQRPTIEDARLVMARQHGFDTWAAFERHVRSLRDGDEEPFMSAARVIQAGDGETLAALLDRYPGLVMARGTNGNDLAALAMGMGRPALLRRLLERGADPASANDRGWTLLHQAAYANDVDTARLLLDAGAPTDRSGHGDGGTALVAALFWGHREAAELIAARDLAPGNLRVAAGLGQLDLLDDLVRPDGGLAAAAGAHRGFYRPHTGFPLWRLSDDPQEVLDEALTWASRSGRTAAAARLVARGARLDADPYRGTALVWAAVNGHREMAAWLLDHGAGVNHRSTFGGPAHGEGVTALHLAAQCGHAGIARLLLDRGADPTVEDAVHHGTPLSWARHFARHEVAGILLEAAR